MEMFERPSNGLGLIAWVTDAATVELFRIAKRRHRLADGGRSSYTRILD